MEGIHLLGLLSSYPPSVRSFPGTIGSPSDNRDQPFHRQGAKPAKSEGSSPPFLLASQASPALSCVVMKKKKQGTKPYESVMFRPIQKDTEKVKVVLTLPPRGMLP